ncbi:hypothetical protein BWQ96_01521 [Gracilariopsis chorda]|uniref:Uncharacterized protein n=1 Tax=Gracilariopsis chorda TaxID=448386 RepID=A0A2V3J2R4_9FLOR|nr:hypothetical protein BWQ96_01521 [Gracilariopsis chorda]|eukprot:PXF48669.1 hypothetical protein BWQ96_01521 [Gracilariopsis chorda]
MMATQNANAVMMFVAVETDGTSILFERQFINAIFNTKGAHWKGVDA